MKLTKRWLTRPTSSPVKPAGWTASDAGSLAAILASLSAVCGLLTGMGLAGVALAVGFKLTAVAAMGAWGGWRRGSTPEERSSLREAVTFGALLTFVSGLALGRFVSVSRLALLLDWGTALTVVLAVQIRTSRAGIRRVADPWLAAAVRDRIVVAILPSGRRYAEIERGIRIAQPARLFVGRPREDLRWIRDLRPAIVLMLDDRRDPPCAGLTRQMANQALRDGVEAFILITLGKVEEPATYSERIVRALAGLTRSRLIRVRMETGPIDARAARLVFRVLIEGADGSLYPQGMPEIQDDAALLWAELDGLESRAPASRAASCGGRWSPASRSPEGPTARLGWSSNALNH